MKTLREIFNFKSNKKIFKDVTLGKGSYGIIAYALRDRVNLVDYYQEGKDNVHSTIENWKCKQVKNECKYGYDYAISILKDGNEIKKGLLCFSCNRIKIEKTIYQLKKKTVLKLLKKNFLEVKREIKKFDNRASGIKYYQSALKDPLLVNYSKLIPNWIDYEGRFKVEIIEDRKEAGFNLTYDKLEKKLKNNLNLVSGELNYRYHLEMVETTETKIIISYFINANETFYQKVDHLNKGSFDKFTDFELELLYKK